MVDSETDFTQEARVDLLRKWMEEEREEVRQLPTLDHLEERLGTSEEEMGVEDEGPTRMASVLASDAQKIRLRSVERIEKTPAKEEDSTPPWMKEFRSRANRSRQ